MLKKNNALFMFPNFFLENASWKLNINLFNAITTKNFNIFLQLLQSNVAYNWLYSKP